MFVTFLSNGLRTLASLITIAPLGAQHLILLVTMIFSLAAMLYASPGEVLELLM